MKVCLRRRFWLLEWYATLRTWRTGMVTGILLVFLIPASITSRGHRARTSSHSHWLVNELDLLSNQEKVAVVRCDEELSDLTSAWIDDVDRQLGHHRQQTSLAEFQYQTNITQYNQQQMEDAESRQQSWFSEQLPIARVLRDSADLICNSTANRLIALLVNYNTQPIANDPQTNREMTHLVSEMESIYSTAVVTDSDGRQYRLEPDLEYTMATSRDYETLKWAWLGWRNVTGPRIQPLYTRLVVKMNEAATDNGFPDVGKSWQMTDFAETEIEPMILRLYERIRPFYQQLHAYVRRRLIENYRHHGMDPRGPIPAHLLGNMWAQDWVNIYDLVAPYPEVESPDVTSLLLRANYTRLGMFRTAEEFFVSLGLEPMTAEFWNKSMFARPSDGREVTCHASAYDHFTQTDFRIKMCTEVNKDYFQTIHHEMGHIEYYMQYRHLANLFRDGANAAFHEAVGDTVALSVVTMQHLHAINLSDVDPESISHEQQINFLMRMALTKVAFLPFSLIMDKWRYEIFRGDVTPADYNRRWWQLREKYQGLKAPVTRTENDFDPGSKYHIPANVPYSRYFLSFVGQFQFHKALCKAHGHRGPLHTCDIYQSSDAGQKLMSVLRVGVSRPWRHVMKTMTGQSGFNVDAILEYFSPLVDWLKQQNAGHHVGWRR